MAHAIIAYKMDARIDTSALSAATVSAASVGYSTLKDRQKEVLVNTVLSREFLLYKAHCVGKLTAPHSSLYK